MASGPPTGDPGLSGAMCTSHLFEAHPILGWASGIHSWGGVLSWYGVLLSLLIYFFMLALSMFTFFWSISKAWHPDTFYYSCWNILIRFDRIRIKLKSDKKVDFIWIDSPISMLITLVRIKLF